MSTTLSDSAVGKEVVDEDGETIGIVSEVKHGTAYVDPDPGITDTIKAKLGWEDADDEDYPLQDAAIGTVTDDKIKLRKTL